MGFFAKEVCITYISVEPLESIATDCSNLDGACEYDNNLIIINNYKFQQTQKRVDNLTYVLERLLIGGETKNNHVRTRNQRFAENPHNHPRFAIRNRKESRKGCYQRPLQLTHDKMVSLTEFSSLEIGGCGYALILWYLDDCAHWSMRRSGKPAKIRYFNDEDSQTTSGETCWTWPRMKKTLEVVSLLQRTFGLEG